MRMAKTTPMIEQYLAIKRSYKDHILFFRLGDFYEMFFEDAITASRELEIVLTSRDSSPERIPMCGVPYHSVSGYLGKLLAKGYKVAICEQVEDPKAVKGIVRREVVRVITPGTIIEDQLLPEKANNYLAAIAQYQQFQGLAYADISTGEFKVTQFPKQQLQLLLAEITRLNPAEIYYCPGEGESLEELTRRTRSLLTAGEAHHFSYENAYRKLQEHFNVQNLRAFGCEDQPAAIIAAGAMMHYLHDTQKNALCHLRHLVSYETGDYMALDPATRRNLELTRTLRGSETSGSLLGVLDLTVTSMGARTLRVWIEQPLTTKAAIMDRQDAVGDLTLDLDVRATLRELLKKTYDLQRILGKLSGSSANGRDLIALRNTLAVIPEVQAALATHSAARIMRLRDQLDPLPELTAVLEAALLEEQPLSIKEGGMIRAGYHPELEKLLTAGKDGKQWVAQLEQAERERTGIKSLKVGFNQVFGYYIEITKSNLNSVPDDYIRKQTLANCERFINQRLKEYENLILNAHEKSVALEYQIFLELREKILAQIDSLQRTSLALAELDALLALAEAGVRYHYVRPEITENGAIRIVDGRHPVVEQMLPSGTFVPNDTLLDLNDNRNQVITGPNMAGKSTYMRQVALIVLLAHVGSFVPAKSASIGLVDRIFTRVGASDDLATGQSTFMVEMNEVAYILNHATAKSFIILDEIGRGTSTFDGLSIAWAVIEFISNPRRIGAKTLIATHYHELTALEHQLEGVKNYHIAVAREGSEITFLRKIMPGCAAQSYGIEVAALAGLPTEITHRAREILKTLETNDGLEQRPVAATLEPPPTEQLTLFHMENQEILDQLRRADLITLTPLQALNLLYEWQQLLKQETV